MERFFILDKFNTWYNWRFYLTAKTIPDAAPNTNYVTLEGMSGTLDLSEALTGEITYSDRTITASFWSDIGTHKEREKRLAEITAALHGRKVKVIEPDDPEHYFYGRVKIKSKKNILPYAEFTIEIVCDPWRYAIDETERRVDVVNGAEVVAAINNRGVKTLCPVIAVTGSVTISSGFFTARLTEGSYKIPDIKFRQGVNTVSVLGSGSVTFVYREATL